VPGGLLVLSAHLALVFALVALWSAQSESSGLLGSLGMVLGVAGTALVSGVVLVKIAGAGGVEVESVLGVGLPSALALLGGLAFLIGLILFGAATMRAGVFPRRAGLLLIAGDVVFGAGSFAGSAATIFEILGAAITCAAFVWLGLSLLRGSGASAGRPARVG
jgi:vacuolar-type H+-ATPase subunit I/STV1